MIIIRKILLLCLFVIAVFKLSAQVTFPENGVADNRDEQFAFKNATIYKSYNEKIDSAILIIKKGKVQAIGKNVSIPKDAIVVDLQGKFIYPSFIDMYSAYGITESVRSRGGFDEDGRTQLGNGRRGAFGWNDALKCEFNANENFLTDKNKAKEYLEQGFGMVNTHRMDGISRGTSAVVLLGDEKENEMIVLGKAAHHLSFSKGTSTQNYPGSLMGSIALLRQTYMDGDWYAKAGSKEQYNISLQTWNDLQKYPQIFEIGDKLSVIRALKIAKEFNKNYIIKASGTEYQRLEDIKKYGTQFIVPLNFPEVYEVEDPFNAQKIDLADMKHWELAPTNPAKMQSAGLQIAITSDGLAKRNEFKTKLLDAIKNGLSKEEALKALTMTPANWLGVSDKAGSLDPGKLADFFISDKDYFTKESRILQNWVKGKVVINNDLNDPIQQGVYNLLIDTIQYKLNINKDGAKYTMSIQLTDSVKIDVNSNFQQNLVTLSFAPVKGKTNLIRLSGTMNNSQMNGTGNMTDGRWVNWQAVYKAEAIAKKEAAKKDSIINELPKSLVMYPWIGFGWTEKPVAKEYLIKNATIWTNEKEGILKNYDLLIKNGKISKLGKNLSSSTAIVIDAASKQVSAGIIDEHSHIAISGGVNECTHAVTSEVRIGDVINCDDVNIYRQLSGGVTAAQLLHGSCNPVGGQSGIIKLRWGYSPEEMKIQNADQYIKFALGENVKVSGAQRNFRFPNTRMGVEQVYDDAFSRAREYLAAKNDKTKSESLRKDLQLEALGEILLKKRFITCHSYVQSEINMLMHVGDEYGFQVNTFTHILEGYKVADKMKQRGIGGSTFADWWAYKFEVYEAIPYNGALMHDEGVVVAYNSDDAEMARRLNQEAAKAVKYGGVSEEEALKFVTLNPAKLLHLDKQMGSIKEGKDADVVIWSDNPLSIYAVAEITFVDGIKFFDRKEMKENEILMQAERNRLIQKMIAFKKNGGKTEKFVSPKKILYHCDTVGE